MSEPRKRKALKNKPPLVEGSALIAEAAKRKTFFDALRAMRRTVDELVERALNGEARSALELAGLATLCTEKLHEVAVKHPAIFQDCKAKERVPVMVERLPGERWPETVREAALQVGCQLVGGPRKTHRDDSRTRIIAEGLVKMVASQRGPDDVTPSGRVVDHSDKVKAILDGAGLQRGGKIWKGWEGAVWFLPPPSEASADLWWRTCLLLKERGGKDWFLESDFLDKVGGAVTDTKTRAVMQKYVHGQLKDRFKEAVGRRGK